MQKIKKGDTVKVMTGKDKGRMGKVLSILSKKKNNRVNVYALVEGINIVKKHTKANPQQQKPGGIIPKESPIHISNVMLMDPASNEAGRVGIKQLEDGRKVRFFKASNEVIDV
tara:strand:- start:18765 stop:19103 length:339 start_codon:yes stop_codon:yes gene_type:complete